MEEINNNQNHSLRIPRPLPLNPFPTINFDNMLRPPLDWNINPHFPPPTRRPSINRPTKHFNRFPIPKLTRPDMYRTSTSIVKVDTNKMNSFTYYKISTEAESPNLLKSGQFYYHIDRPAKTYIQRLGEKHKGEFSLLENPSFFTLAETQDISFSKNPLIFKPGTAGVMRLDVRCPLDAPSLQKTIYIRRYFGTSGQDVLAFSFYSRPQGEFSERSFETLKVSESICLFASKAKYRPGPFGPPTQLVDFWDLRVVNLSTKKVLKTCKVQSPSLNGNLELSVTRVNKKCLFTLSEKYSLNMGIKRNSAIFDFTSHSYRVDGQQNGHLALSIYQKELFFEENFMDKFQGVFDLSYKGDLINMIVNEFQYCVPFLYKNEQFYLVMKKKIFGLFVFDKNLQVVGNSLNVTSGDKLKSGGWVGLVGEPENRKLIFCAMHLSGGNIWYCVDLARLVEDILAQKK